MPGEVGKFGRIGDVGEECACQVERCAGVDVGSGNGATWLGEIHLCGLKTVLWCALRSGCLVVLTVVVVKSRQVLFLFVVVKQ